MANFKNIYAWFEHANLNISKETSYLTPKNFMKAFKHFLVLAQVVFLLQLISCEDKKNKGTVEQTDLLSQRSVFSIQAVVGARKQGEKIRFDVEKTDTTQAFDSVVVRLENETLGRMTERIQTFYWSSEKAGMGEHVFTITGFRKGAEAGSASQSVFICAPQPPVEYRYEIVKTLPHSTGSFTQGLEWNGEKLYEGTGLNGKSFVAEVDVQTGKPLVQHSLSQEFFGEGITIEANKLYQLTWQNRKGFVYSLPDLKPLKEFGYPTDGWGLTHLSDRLAMTDGSHKVYFLDKETFTSKGKIEVWDHKNPVDALNELEFVNGKVYANKYQTDTLVEFDPVSGMVTGYVDLTGILKDSDRQGEEDVLNGIAYHSADKLFYVTGKNWPKMYAIRLVQKKAI